MTNPDQGDRYTHGHHASVVDQHRRRTAEEAAAFLLPRLTPAMRILDFGCGPGSITVGLARRVPDGQVVGIDVVPEVIEQARELAATSDLHNLHVETGDVYALQYEDNSFDVAYGHQVLQHLSHPVSALRELRRVVRPGGLVAVRDADYGTMVHAPRDPRLDQWLQLYHAVAQRNEAEADAGRYLHGWLQQAGYEAPEMSSSTWTFYQPRQVLNWGDSWAQRTTESAFATQAVEYGLATATELQQYATAWREWARRPDAFFAFIHVEGLATVPA
jgi:ubiquinone/menaquinone biosynthesis C-methylase UbiE